MIYLQGVIGLGVGVAGEGEHVVGKVEDDGGHKARRDVDLQDLVERLRGWRRSVGETEKMTRRRTEEKRREEKRTEEKRRG